MQAETGAVRPVRHRARTLDGWNLGLRRYQPLESTGRPPVVCSHGLAGTSLLFDLHPGPSLARHLAAAGFDTWLLDLRGRDVSWPDLGPDPRQQWDFDAFVELDIPAALDHVAEVTGSADAFFIGQEMSGQAAYAAIAARTTSRIRALVTLGAPAVTPPEARVPGVSAPPRIDIRGRVPYSVGARLAGPLLAHLAPAVLSDAFAPDTTEAAVAARYLRHGVPDEALALVEQFRDWFTDGSMRSGDGVDYAKHLGEVTLPALLIAGAVDRQRPAAAVADTAAALGGDDVTFVNAGIAGGYRVDYGHDDVLAGRMAPVEIYPLIVGWLTDRSPA